MGGLWTKHKKKQTHSRHLRLPRGRCDREPCFEHDLLVDVDDRHQQREDERPDDEADDAERLHYQEPNPQGKPVRCTRGKLRYRSRRRKRVLARLRAGGSPSPVAANDDEYL
jgi:hypothetical protein